ncbi:Baeyer-Villiger monooxygenase [Colletotrichum siamense]|nr:Baeyer-Villiger monooxygenase [Colletotrichum siamense]
MVAVDDKRPQITCRFVVFGTGSLTKPYVPAFPKLDELTGQVIHPRHWPDGLDVRGKMIGIIGQSATGLQIVQELAKQDCELSVFVRSSCIAVPMGQRSLSFEETEQMKNPYKGIFFKAKYSSASALPYNQSCDKFVEATENFWAQRVRSHMSNRGKMDVVAPPRQSEHFGGRRVNLQEGSYEMLDRSNVEVVDLKARLIRKFHRDGVLVGRHLPAQLILLDVVVFATGYNSFTGSLFDMNIYDKHGVPQASTSQANAPPFIELQVDWIAAKEQAKSEFEKSLMKESRAWWTGANIPGKTQEPMIYFGGVKQWTQEYRQVLTDWSRLSVEGV